MGYRAFVKPLEGLGWVVFVRCSWHGGEGQCSHQFLKQIPDLHDGYLPCCLPIPIHEGSSFLLFCWVVGHCFSIACSCVSPFDWSKCRCPHNRTFSWELWKRLWVGREGKEERLGQGRQGKSVSASHEHRAM